MGSGFSSCACTESGRKSGGQAGSQSDSVYYNTDHVREAFDRLSDLPNQAARAITDPDSASEVTWGPFLALMHGHNLVLQQQRASQESTPQNPVIASEEAGIGQRPIKKTGVEDKLSQTGL